MWALVEAGGMGKKRTRAKTGARRVSSPFSHDRFLALIMLIFLWSARAKPHCRENEWNLCKIGLDTNRWERKFYACNVCILHMDYCRSFKMQAINFSA